MNTAMILFGVTIILAVYGAANIYIGTRLFQWLKWRFPGARASVFTAVFALVAGSLLLSMMPLPAGIKTAFGWFGSYWMGIFVYLLLFLFAADLVLVAGTLLKLVPSPVPGRIRFAAGSAALLLTACVVGYGIFNAHQVRHVSYTVQTGEAKAPAGLHIVLISDLHLGAVHSERHLERIIDEINRLEPDLVCIAGDIFNDDFNAIRDPDKASALLRSLKTRYGVYASLGNHDSGQTFGLMTAFLERSNVKLLTDEYVIVDGRLALFGRVDPSPIGGFGGLERKEIADRLEALDPALPVVVMDHTPVRLDEYDGRVDLVLAGHTHQGQIFPANLITDAIFVVDHGHYQKDAGSPHVIVTSGAGTWGMPMRVGTNNEIVSIYLQ